MTRQKDSLFGLVCFASLLLIGSIGASAQDLEQIGKVQPVEAQTSQPLAKGEEKNTLLNMRPVTLLHTSKGCMLLFVVTLLLVWLFFG